MAVIGLLASEPDARFLRLQLAHGLDTAFDLARPDLVIYLHAKPETLVARVRKRGIEMERRIGEGYLALLAERHRL